MIRPISSLSLILAIGSSLLGKAIDIDSTTCDADCIKDAVAAAEWEASQHADPSYSFYVAPSNFSDDLVPGTILQVEYETDLANYTVPNGLSMSRIIYTTEDLNGKVLPASAYILWPYNNLLTEIKGNCTKAMGLPMAAWSHGTSGVLSHCSPSNYRSLQYHFMAPYQLALQGMAVVAADYAGLGIGALPSGEPIHHPWLSGPSQATDVANAVIAAREAFPDLLAADGPFVSIGHSQGGGAAWSFAERMAEKPLDGYRGAVAIAPSARTYDVLTTALEDPKGELYELVITSGQPKLIGAVTALYPEFNYTGFTDTITDRWFNVYEPLNVCLPGDGFAFAGVAPDDLVEEGWNKLDEAVEYFQRAQSGGKDFKGPLLVVSGDGDQTVPIWSVNTAIDETCDLMESEGSMESLEFITYAESNHFPVIQASQLKWLAWVKDRLTGAPGPKPGCSSSLKQGVRTEGTMDSIGPNFLVTWESMANMWRYVL